MEKTLECGVLGGPVRVIAKEIDDKDDWEGGLPRRQMVRFLPVPALASILGMHDSAAITYGPDLRAISEDTKQMMGGGTCFRLPMPAAIGGIQNNSVGTNRPQLRTTSPKSAQCVVSSARFRTPMVTAIHRGQDGARIAGRPNLRTIAVN